MRRIVIRHWLYLFFVTGFFAGSACTPAGSDYNRLVEKELAKGTRSDSLFMGIYLGMPSKTFYAHCWDMNKKGLFTNGTNNISVLYKIDKDLKHQASMNFYPDFYEDKIFSMWATFEYDAWAPWNKPMQADSLLPDVLQLYKRWYPGGNEFITLTNEKRGTIFVKVDGNRRITIGKFDDRMVKVDYTDLLIEQKLKK